MRTSESECIEALREAAERLGESPTKAQYEELGLTPASATIIRTMGGWNAAKEAAGLETYQSRGPRVGPKPDDVDLPDGTSWADLSVDQRWHYRNVEWNAERTLRRRARLRSWVTDIKGERGCTRCGIDDPTCLDLHHLDDERKEMAITRMVTYGYGKVTLREEMANCEVLCANCHRKEHGDRLGDGGDRYEVRAWTREYKQSVGGCERCEESDPICLDFHHVDGEKETSVAQLVSDGRSKETVREEIANCIVLCANCHRKEHFQPPDTDG